MGKETFMIVIAHSIEGITVRKFTGTREEAQDKVMAIILADRKKKENAKYFDDENSTVDVYDLDYNGDGNGFRGHNDFYSYHIDYAAFPIEDIASVRKLRKAS